MACFMVSCSVLLANAVPNRWWGTFRRLATRLRQTMRNLSLGLVLGCCWGALACGGAHPAEAGAPANDAANPPGAEAAPTTFGEQVALGQKLYGQNCASCHGPGGEGTGDAPRVVGLKEGALPLDPPATAKFRKTQFKTVMDVGAFVVENMPPNKAGSLSAEQYFSILAFDLKANGIDLGDKKLDADLAKTLTIPR
jgi:cytochrome c